MGLSSFWSSFRGQKVKEIHTPPKHSHPIYDQHATVPSPQAHSALRPNNSDRETLSIGSSPTTKKQKRRSLWKSPESDLVSVVQQVPAVPAMPAIDQSTDKKAKRRSFWRAASQNDLRTTQEIPLLERSLTSGGGEKLRKRRSLWRGQSQNDAVPALPLDPSMGPAPAPDIDRHPENKQSTSADKKQRRLSRRLSSASISSKRLSRSLSIFGGRADDDSDDDVPAVPAIPHASLWEQQRDQGRYYGMVDEHPVTPGTAITSDELYNTAAKNHDAPARNKEKRLSRGLSLSRTKSSASRATNSSKRSSSAKRKRRSWFGSSNPDDEDDTPPLPQLPSLVHDGALTPSTDASDFERFLHTSHEASQRRNSQRMSQQPTDYDRFMRESRMYDDSMGEPAHTAHRSSKDMKQPRPKSTISGKRSSYTGPRNAAGGFLKTSTEVPANVRRSWRRSYGPGAYGGRAPDDERALNVDMVCLSDEQQQEWDKLKELMEVMERRQDDGVFGMLRQLEEDEDEEAFVSYSKHERDNEGGLYENRDALAALEYGTAR